MPREAQLKKKMESNLAARSAAANVLKCAPLDCKYNLFSTVYNILASFSDLTNPLVQYSVYVENKSY